MKSKLEPKEYALYTFKLKQLADLLTTIQNTAFIQYGEKSDINITFKKIHKKTKKIQEELIKKYYIYQDNISFGNIFRSYMDKELLIIDSNKPAYLFLFPSKHTNNLTHDEHLFYSYFIRKIDVINDFLYFKFLNHYGKSKKVLTLINAIQKDLIQLKGFCDTEYHKSTTDKEFQIAGHVYYLTKSEGQEENSREKYLTDINSTDPIVINPEFLYKDNIKIKKI